MPPPAIRSSAWAGGAEYNLNIKATAPPRSTTGAAGETLVLDNIQLAYSTDHLSVEFAIPAAALGNPGAIDTLYDVNDSAFRSHRLHPASPTWPTPTTA